MTVQELINKLQQFDPQTEVVCSIMDHTDWGYKLPINEIELGNPYDEGGYSAIDNSEMDYDTCYNEDEDTEEEIYVGPKAVVIDLGQL
jgi:hypothetical protein